MLEDLRLGDCFAQGVLFFFTLSPTLLSDLAVVVDERKLAERLLTSCTDLDSPDFPGVSPFDVCILEGQKQNGSGLQSAI